MASPTWWTWIWVNSGSWWWTGRPGVLRFMGSQRVGHDWATELNWLQPGQREDLPTTFLTVLKKHPFYRARGTWMWGCQWSCSPPGRQSQLEAGKMKPKQRWRSGGCNPTTNPNGDFVCARNKCSFLWQHARNLLSSIDLWWPPVNSKPWGLDLLSARSEQLNPAVLRERVLGALRIICYWLKPIAVSLGST